MVKDWSTSVQMTSSVWNVKMCFEISDICINMTIENVHPGYSVYKYDIRELHPGYSVYKYDNRELYPGYSVYKYDNRERTSR